MKKPEERSLGRKILYGIVAIASIFTLVPLIKKRLRQRGEEPIGERLDEPLMARA